MQRIVETCCLLLLLLLVIVALDGCRGASELPIGQVAQLLVS